MTISGVGLIGGSLGMLARREGLVGRIVGFGRGEANLKVALDRGIIDVATRDPVEAAQGADLVVLATPIRALLSTFAALKPSLAGDAVITDVGSVKRWVIDRLEPLLGPEMALVAVHPVAGKATTGAAAADARLFAGQRVIITPSARCDPGSLGRIEALWRATGARVELMPPLMHDRLLACSSHLPQIVATALAAAIGGEKIDGREAADYGGSGLRDMTRLAASSAEIWADICLTNRDAILDALAHMDGVLSAFTKLIDESDEAGLKRLFERGNAVRARIAGSAGQ
jgi:prephenate dehydrogenase